MAKKSSKLSNDQKKDLAYEMYMNTAKNQNEICAIIDIAPKTFTKWKQEGMWEELKSASTITAKSIEINVLNRLHEMSLDAKTLNADAMAKLARVIEVITEKRYTISQMMNVFMAFTNWLFAIDPDAAKVLNKYQKTFVDEEINKAK